MEPTDLTIEILQSIRDEVKQTNVRLDQTNERLNQTNERLEQLARRVVESEIRTSTAIAELAGSVREMTSLLKSSIELRPRVEKCESEIAALRQRVDRIAP
jgi:chromosome segregation ATPase